MLYNIVLVSALYQHESAIGMSPCILSFYAWLCGSLQGRDSKQYPQGTDFLVEEIGNKLIYNIPLWLVL